MQPGERIRVLLADDHRILREALRSVLAAECDIVAEASTGEQAIQLVAQFKPDVAVIDISMPGIGGLAAASQIRRRTPACKVLVLSQYEDEEYVLEALGEAQVAGYLVKTDAAAALLEAVRVVHSGRRYISPSVAPVVLNRVNFVTRQHSGELATGHLTRREREVLKLIAEGATTKEVASTLGLSPKTAQVHRENIKRKLALRTTAAMVMYAIKHKLIRLE